ncbi:hypothetical protein ACFOOP_14470 [Marinicaulis aureus]|uniref:Regulatory protein GemA n=1 Tax=Hyphococcus aureus TaxID=2666033 RepID=A0ABW1KXW4_9PROT
MAETHVITGLKARRASIAADIDELDRQRRLLLGNLRHVDATLKIMGFEGNPESIKTPRKRRAMFRRGELRRFVLAAIRKHGAEISHGEIAAIILEKMEWEDDGELLGVISEKVRQARKDIKRRRDAASSLSTGG